jgi:preprotein translocase subunit SecF
MMKLLKLVPDNTNIDFMRWRNLALVLSILATVASLVLVGVKGLNLGVDFLGGQMVRVTFAKQIDVEQLRSDVGALNVGEGSIQETGGPRSYQIRLPKPDGGEAAANRAASQVRAMLGQKYPGSRVDSVDTVSGKVSEELAWDGALAITLSMLGIAIYIWFRFEWQFGLGGVMALFHDVILTLGLFSIFRFEFTLTIIAALLTIIGYSMNDTVVVFDRLRENLRKYKRMPLGQLVDLSLNETLSRTIITGCTALFALIGLLYVGGEALSGFAIAMIFGIIIGTYSSLYVAAPAILLWGVRRGREGEARGAPQTAG